MKIFASAFLFLISIPSLILFFNQSIDSTAVTISLGFALFSFIIIANHDAIEIKYKNLQLKIFQKKVDQIKNSAVEDLKKEILELEANMHWNIMDIKDELRREIENAKYEATADAVDEIMSP